MKKIMIVVIGSVLLAGCVEDDAYYTTSYHEHHPHLHTQTAAPVSHGYEVGHAATPAVSTGYQVHEAPAPEVSTGYEANGPAPEVESGGIN